MVIENEITSFQNTISTYQSKVLIILLFISFSWIHCSRRKSFS